MAGIRTVWRNGARDWDERGHRLGFDGSKAMSDFRPQWHHIFPQKFLEEAFDEEQIQALANIAVIGASINIRINAKDPLDYLARYKIGDDKLRQQFVPIERSAFAIDSYPAFLKQRSEELARQGNAFLDSLSKGLDLESLPEPEQPSAEDEAGDEGDAGDDADGDDWKPNSEQLRAFRQSASATEPALRSSLFRRDKGWKRYKSERWLWVAFTRWEWVGFFFGVDPEAENRIYVGVYCDKKWVRDNLWSLIEPKQQEIRAALGPSCVFDSDDRWCPVYEYLPLESVGQRMAEYVRVLSPYLELVPASRGSEDESADADGPIASLQSQFWTRFREHVQKTGSRLQCPPAKAQGWMMFGSGSAAHPLVAVASQKRIVVYVACKGPSRTRDFEALLAQKGPIEAEFGQSLEWRPLPEKQESQILVRSNEGKLTDETTWESIHRWMLANLERMQKVLGPRISGLRGG